MNHPKREEWVPYLYGETRLEERRRLHEHLHGCPECREELDAWRRSLERLNAWKLPKTRAIAESALPFLKWAAAAAVVLGLGFGLGRLSGAKADAERIRATIEPEIRQQLGQEFAQYLHQQINEAASSTLARANRHTDSVVADYSQALYAAMKQDVDTVRQDVATLAVNADVGLRRTEQQLVQLADDTEPANFSKPSSTKQ